MAARRAISSATQDDTFLAFKSPKGIIPLDCAASPYQKLLKAGLNPERLMGIILTHAHPDHIYGLPSLIYHLWNYDISSKARPRAVKAAPGDGR